MEYGDESDGPIPPPAGLEVSGAAMLPQPPVTRMNDQEDHAFSTRNMSELEHPVRPSSIYKKDSIVEKKPRGSSAITPMKATIGLKSYPITVEKKMRESVTTFDMQSKTPQPRNPNPDGHEPSIVVPDGKEPARVIFDKDADNKFEQEGSVMLDPMQNPDEDVIDPVTIYRFQENTRRLDRLRAELNNQPIADPLVNIRNAGSIGPGHGTIDPNDIIQSRQSREFKNGLNSRSSSTRRMRVESRGIARSNLHSRGRESNRLDSARRLNS